MRVSTPELGVIDSVIFTVTPGAAAGVRSAIADTLINIGESITVNAMVLDRYGNVRTEVPAFTAGPENVFALDAATGKVTALELGTQYVFARYAAFVDSTKVRILPGGTLVVWNRLQRTLQLLSLGRPHVRTIASDLITDRGIFPRFGPTGALVTTRLSQIVNLSGDSDDDIFITDTNGVRVRYISSRDGFQSVLSNRLMADGSLLVVGRLVRTPPAYALYRVSITGAISKVTDIPDLILTSGEADISYDGTRIAFLVPIEGRRELRTLDVATGAIKVLEPDARSPRWSHNNDRIAFTTFAFSQYSLVGAIAIINADGTGRRTFGDTQFYPGFAWSPTDTFIIGGNPQTHPYLTTRLMRVRDGAATLFAFRATNGDLVDYSQFDWQ